MNVAKIILIFLWGISLLLSAHLHGKPKHGNNNFFVDLIGTLIHIGLLWWGGFFG